jgi:ribose transport system permease protein
MTTTARPPTDTVSPPGRGSAIRDRLQQLLAFASLIVIFAFFAFSSESFATTSNVTSILFSTVVIGTLALGTTFVIITGGIDLSIGTGMTLCAVMSGVFIVNVGLPLPLGVLCAILFGGLIGLINGFNVAVLKLPPFIATLADDAGRAGAGAGHLRQRADLLLRHPRLRQDLHRRADPRPPNAGTGAPRCHRRLRRAARDDRAGRYTYSIGSNEEATALSGINVRRWKILIYTLPGFSPVLPAS